MTYAGNLGTGGSTLDALYGSSTLPNSNEPTLLDASVLFGADAPYLFLPGTFPNIGSSPNSTALQITGDIDIAVRVLPNEWEPAAAQTIVAKWIFGGASYRLYIGPTGLTLDTFGAAIVSATASLSFLAGITQPIWLRATRDMDNGTGGNTTVFYWSAEEQEPTSWSEIATVTNIGTTSITTFTMSLEIGSDGGFGFNVYTGRVYRVIIRNGINGIVAFDADFSSTLLTGSETTITESSPNAATVTIGRATTGRKTAAITQPVWLLGADDFFEVASSTLLDIPTGSSATILVVARAWDTQAANASLLARSDATAPIPTGYRLINGATPLEASAIVGDGVDETIAAAPARIAGDRAAIFLVRDASTGTVSAWTNAVEGTPVADLTLNLSNSLPLRIGASTPTAADFADIELFAAAVWQRALSSSEISSVVEYYGL